MRVTLDYNDGTRRWFDIADKEVNDGSVFTITSQHPGTGNEIFIFKKEESELVEVKGGGWDAIPGRLNSDDRWRTESEGD